MVYRSNTGKNKWRSKIQVSTPDDKLRCSSSGMQKMTNSFEQIMLFYITPALAGIVGIVIYA